MRNRRYIYIVWLLTVVISTAGFDVKPVQAVSEAGLVGYWKLDEGAGTKVKDSSGNGNYGTLNTFASPATAVSGWTTAGKIGRALNFDGSNDCIGLGNPASLQFTGNITMSAWIKPLSSSGIQNVLEHGYVTGPGQEVGLRISSGTYEAVSWNDTNHVASMTMPASDIGQWVHIVGTHDGTAWRIYRNGVLGGTTVDSFGSMVVNDNWGIGGSQSCSSRFFNGEIDDVRIYNRALSAAEVQSLYQLGGGTRLAQTLDSNLVAYWKFDEDTGTTAKDWTLRGNTGTLNNISDPPAATSGWTSKGKIGRALRFDGTDDFVKAPTNLIGTTNLTVSEWVYWRGDTSAAKILFYNGNTGADGFGLIIGGVACSGGPQVRLLMGGVSCDAFSPTGPTVVANQWNHVMLTRDSTTWKLYVNGVYTGATSSSNPGTPTQSFMVGGNHSGGNPFDGSIDDVRVYNRTLSASEALALYKTTGNVAKQANENGLVGYWKFDEGATNKATDSSGNGNRGTLTNMADPATAVSGWTNAGKLGRAINFDGSNDYVQLPTSLTRMSGTYTISAWINPSTISSEQYITADWDVSGRNYLFRINSSGYLSLLVGDGGTNQDSELTSTNILAANTWQHVVVVINGTSHLLYINGVLAGSAVGSYSGGVDSSTRRIGADFNGGSVFKGSIDDVRMYSRSLSANEINSLYQGGAVRLNP